MMRKRAGVWYNPNMKGLMDLDGITNRPTKRRKARKAKCETLVHELMASGEFDGSNPTHVHMRNAAIKRKAAPDWGEEDNTCQDWKTY